MISREKCICKAVELEYLIDITVDPPIETTGLLPPSLLGEEERARE